MTDGLATGACLLCGSAALEDVIDLRPTPPANALASTAEEAQGAVRFPLRLMRCAACSHVQLADQVDRDVLFRDYKYATGAAPGLVRHFGALARILVDRHQLAPGSAVVEIGSNDGTLLREFAGKGMRVLGVDPAVDLARHARETGVPTYATHFDDSVAEKILAERGPADMVLANNVLAHVGDLNGTLKGIRRLLKPGSHGVFEAAHLLPMAVNGMYEFIYHEHMSYFSLYSMRAAVNRHGMEIVDVEEVTTQGGSIRCWVQPANTVTPVGISPRVAELLHREDAAGIIDGSVMTQFARRVSRISTALRDVINGLRGSGKHICGYGASARAVTLMTQAGIDDVIEWVIDDNPRKAGLYVPGSGTPVVTFREFDRDAADYCVLFAWNFWTDIAHKMADFTRGGGMFVVPFPELTVL